VGYDPDVRSLGLVLLTVVAAGCQDDIATPFPEGLEPLDDDAEAGAIDAPNEEDLVTRAVDDDGFVKVYGKGYIFAPLAEVFAAAQVPEALIARCNTNAQTVVQVPDEMFTLSFDVSYRVDNILTVEWTDRWRGEFVGDDKVMIKHQKIMGSDFIDISRGTIQLIATSDDVTEIQFVEHLQAISGGIDEVVKGTVDTYAGIRAGVHGEPIPSCFQ
jgi:hypothetical protein